MEADPQDLELALELADIADVITLERFRAADLKVERKPDMTPVTEADTAVERALRARLAAARPGDAVLGEEYGDSGTGARRWILDPIDGTKSFVRGMPTWATLIALQDGEEPTIGVVSAPEVHRRWWAARGAGAFVDDGLAAAPRRIEVSGIDQLADAQLSFGGIEDWEGTGQLDSFLALIRRCWRTRGLGDLWSYMLVAEGAAEIGVDPVVSVWDLAAPQVIVEEAGGKFTDLSGVRRPDGGSGLATNGLVHEAALAIIGRPSQESREPKS